MRFLPDRVAPTPQAMAALGEIAKKYGVTFLAPPGARPSELERN
ncbi:MAG TPA: hypothetical protein VJ777_11790 [Mycobacterium sp.]|nr:hypothetical protein [Mycobacterium sp.]